MASWHVNMSKLMVWEISSKYHSNSIVLSYKTYV